MIPVLAELWRYPVKSMGGERLTSATVDPGGGIVGDRTWAVRDVMSRTFVSAKRDPRMLYMWASTEPDGEIGVNIPGVARSLPVAQAADAIGAWLDRRVATVKWDDADPNDAFDFGFPIDPSVHSFGDCGDVLHLITSGTLRYFASLDGSAMSLAEATRRARPNLVIDSGAAPFAEDEWIGRCLTIGTTRLTVTAATTRCRIVERAQPGDPARDTVLAELTDQREGRLGVYAVVDEPGVLAPGAIHVGG